MSESSLQVTGKQLGYSVCVNKFAAIRLLRSLVSVACFKSPSKSKIADQLQARAAPTGGVPDPASELSRR